MHAVLPLAIEQLLATSPTAWIVWVTARSAARNTLSSCPSTFRLIDVTFHPPRQTANSSLKKITVDILLTAGPCAPSRVREWTPLAVALLRFNLGFGIVCKLDLRAVQCLKMNSVLFSGADCPHSCFSGLRRTALNVALKC